MVEGVPPVGGDAASVADALHIIAQQRVHTIRAPLPTCRVPLGLQRRHRPRQHPGGVVHVSSVIQAFFSRRGLLGAAEETQRSCFGAFFLLCTLK
jgi:hypothetical protein